MDPRGQRLSTRGASDNGARIEVGVALRIEGPSVVVRIDDGELYARRAVSCLVEPQGGDAVLVTTSATGSSYVLAVLEREEGQPTVLRVEDDLAIVTPTGRVTVTAAEGIHFVTPGKVETTASEISMRAKATTWAGEILTLAGAVADVNFSSARSVVDKLETVADRWVQRMNRVYRQVAELDSLKANTIDIAATETMNLRAKNAVVSAESLVKVDGDQIHLG